MQKAKNNLERNWHLVNVQGKILGRVATDIAKLLMGKSKPNFIRNLDLGDFVVVTNAKEIKVTGGKELKKIYSRHSGYPGGFKQETLGELRARNPQEIIKHAVSGMLPQNKLKARFLTRLFIFEGEEHTYRDKFKKEKGEQKS
jgi:large subunit ribosomal protein L13